eukprot:1053335_1
MSIVYLLLFYLIHNVHSTGESGICTDENLSLAKQDIIDMDSEIRQLLMNNSVTITNNDELSIESCESQVVAGTNYRLTTNFGIIQLCRHSYRSRQSPSSTNKFTIFRFKNIMYVYNGMGTSML